MDKSTKIAFLGLGIMGAPMASRVAGAGFPLTVWNRSPERARALVAQGATAAATPAEAVTDADVVITMLADPRAVREVYAAFADSLKPGARVVDASSIGPDALREVTALLPEGTSMVDAPVMGSSDRAANGELSVLVGGADADVEALTPLLELFGTISQVGPLGNAAALKVVLMGAVVAGVTIVGEAMAVADSLGLPEELVRLAMGASPLAGIAGRAFAEGTHFPIRLAAKDVALGTSVRKLPVAEAVHQVLSEAGDRAEEDLSAIVGHIRTAR